MKNKIIELCVDIYAHDQLDFEITLGGNGCNAFECSGVADVLLDILNIERKDIQTKIDAHVKELEDWYG